MLYSKFPADFTSVHTPILDKTQNLTLTNSYLLPPFKSPYSP